MSSHVKTIDARTQWSHIAAMTDPACQIYLITPPVIDDLDAFCEALDKALAAAPVACLQLRLKEVDDSAVIQAGGAMLPICHAHGTLLLVNDRPDIAHKIGADGAPGTLSISEVIPFDGQDWEGNIKTLKDRTS